MIAKKWHVRGSLRIGTKPEQVLPILNSLLPSRRSLGQKKGHRPIGVLKLSVSILLRTGVW